MPPGIEELDYQETPLGAISLRRRVEPRLDNKVLYEVKLGDEYLMSSLFVEGEVQLARLGLARLEGDKLDIVVGGLGLGHTAVAVLEDDRVRSMTVIDIMQPVIDWHQRGIVPLGETLANDPRCTLVHGDFFAIASNKESGFLADDSSKLVHAVLLDIDHSPSHWLNSGNSNFYSDSTLNTLRDKLHPGGVFGLWSNDPPEPEFVSLLGSVFERVESHVVEFENPYSGGVATNTVYLGSK